MPIEELNACETPMEDHIERFIQQLRDGWRVRTSQMDGLASASYGDGFSKAILAQFDRVPTPTPTAADTLACFEQHHKYVGKCPYCHTELPAAADTGLVERLTAERDDKHSRAERYKAQRQALQRRVEELTGALSTVALYCSKADPGDDLVMAIFGVIRDAALTPEQGGKP